MLVGVLVASLRARPTTIFVEFSRFSLSLTSLRLDDNVNAFQERIKIPIVNFQHRQLRAKAEGKIE